MNVDLDLLRAFVAVAESGSFTAAADVVGRSQSAVSQKILRLEDMLGLRVFDRTSRSLSLTSDGERLLVAGRRMLAQYDVFIHELREPPTVTTLRVGISENLVQTQLPALLARFSVRYPNINIELTTGTSDELVDGHDAGLLDVVIAKRKKAGAGHRGRVIWREPLVWIAGDGYRHDSRRPVRLVMMRPPCAYRDVMIDALSSIRCEWVAACTASSLVGLQAAVTAGLGVTVLGKSFVQSGMKILAPSAQWPALPAAEVAVIGEGPGMQHLVQPFVAMLTDTLAESASSTLDTAA